MENDKVTLKITHLESFPLGRSYSGSTFEVASKHLLSNEQLQAMFRAGVIGCGQEFRILQESVRTESTIHGSRCHALVEVRCDSGD